MEKEIERPYLCIKDFAGFSSKTYQKGKIYNWGDIHINWQSNFSQHFEPVSKSISDMTDQKLNTIDTYQNKNRGFKEDERERFRNY